MSHGGSRTGAGHATKNDQKLKKIFNNVSGIAKLNKIGIEEEDRVIELLKKGGVLSELDNAMIRAYSLAFQEWNTAEASLIKQGTVIENSSGNPIANPYLRIRDNAFKRMLEVSREMGFTVKSRSKMDFKEQKEESEMMKILSRER